MSLGDNIGFESLLMMEVSILGNYSVDSKNNGFNNSLSSFSKEYSEYGLPDEVTIIPWIVLNNPDKVYNYRTCEFFDSIQDAINDDDTLDCDYIGISKEFINENIIFNKTVYLDSVSRFNVSFVNCSIVLVSSNNTIEGITFKDSNIIVNGSSCDISYSIFNTCNLNISNIDEYIGFCEFNESYLFVNGDSITIESNKFSRTNISVNNSCNVTIIGNIISSNEEYICINNIAGDINFNSIVCSVFIEDCSVNLTNNWWGVNNPNFDNIIGDFNISSWLVLTLNSYVDWSSNASSGSYDMLVISDLTHNNLGEDLSGEYTLDDIELYFSSTIGDITNIGVLEDGFISVVLNNSVGGDCSVYVTLDNQSICNNIIIPTNDSYGIVNNRSGKGYISIQECINDNETVNGDVIVLSEGFYTENIFVYKNISLFGNGIVYLNPFNESLPTITVFGIGGSFSNLCVSNSEDFYAVSIYSIGSIFYNCSFSDSYSGIYGMGCVNLSIINCSFESCEYGIYISSCDDISLINSSFVGCDYGFYSVLGVNASINGVVFDEDWIGISLVNESGCSINGSDFIGACLGLEIINSNNINISFNRFISNVVAYSTFNSSVLNDNLGSNVFNSSILADFSSFDDSSIILQYDMWSCGPASLATVLGKLGYSNFTQDFIINYTSVDGNGSNLLNLYLFLRDNGFDCRGLKLNSSSLVSLDVVLLNISGNLHYCVVFNITDDWVVLGDSTLGLVNVSRESFDGLFTGYVLVVEGSNRTGVNLTKVEMGSIYGTFDAMGSVTAAYNLLNQPAFTIPGYSNLDNLGTTGWLIKGTLYWTLGINDNGSMSWLDLGINVLSIVSGVGAVTRVIRSVGKLSKFEKITKNIEKTNDLTKSSQYEKLMNALGGFAYGVDVLSTLTDTSRVFTAAYGSLLEVGNFATKTDKIQNIISKNRFINKYFGSESFIVNYLSNGFRTMGTLLNINNYRDIYNNVVNFYNTIKSDAKTVVNKVSSTVKTVTKKMSNTVKSATKVATKTLKTVAKKASNVVKTITTAVKKTVKKAVKKVVKNVKKTVKRAVRTVKKVVKTVKRTSQKIVKKVKSAYNYISKCISKLRFW